jgi:hypothetical protein
MPASNIYDTLRQRVEKSHGLMEYERQAWLFFKAYQSPLIKWQQSVLRKHPGWSDLKQETPSKRVVSATGAMPGQLYFFLYNPKLRLTLPYYDMFPLVLVLDKGPNWFFGMNFHYLNYEQRARFFDALYNTYTVNKSQSLKARMLVTYDILQTVTKPAIAKYYKPCLKRYLIPRLQTPLLQVGEEYWQMALFLPVDMFRKKTRSQVWRETTIKINQVDIDEEEGGGGEE